MTTDPLATAGVVLLALFVLLSWLTRRVQGGSSRRASTRGERVALTPDHAVHVVEAGGLRLLVGTGPGSAPQLLATLGEVEAGEEPAGDRGAARPGRPSAIDLLGRLGIAGGR